MLEAGGVSETGGGYWDVFTAVWNDGRKWTYAIDPAVPSNLRKYAEKAAIRRCEQLMERDRGK
jgi:hypothetical protein